MRQVGLSLTLWALSGLALVILVLLKHTHKTSNIPMNWMRVREMECWEKDSMNIMLDFKTKDRYGGCSNNNLYLLFPAILCEYYIFKFS